MTQDIHSLLAKHFQGLAADDEVRTIQLWRDASPENENEYNQLKNLWSKAGDAPAAVLFDTGKAWHKVNGVIKKEESKPTMVSLFTKKAVMAAAACLILAACAWWLIKQQNDITTFTAKADAERVSLKDGSAVYLRKGARLSYPENFDANVRKVSLTGEAFFEVRHNPAKQFIIAASATEVKVLGTSFSVNNEAGKVEVIVKTGKVQFITLKDTSTKVFLTAGERAVFQNNLITKQNNNDLNFDAWQSGQLIFNNTSLQQIAQTISQSYGVSLLLKNEDRVTLEQTKVTISFNRQPLSVVLKELSLITTFTIKQINSTTYQIATQE